MPEDPITAVDNDPYYNEHRAVDQNRSDESITRFRAELSRLNDGAMVDRHIVFGDAFAIEKDKYFFLKEQIARQFNVPIPHVIMVGSGKLGFSLSPTKLFRPFGESSDLDMAIVSSDLFDSKWLEIYKMQNAYGDWPDKARFFRKISEGWLRPDLLPRAQVFGKRLWDFLRELEKKNKHGGYPLRLAIYKHWDFLRVYQMQGIKACREYKHEN